MVMLGIFIVCMIMLISLTVYAIFQTDKCPNCRGRDWEVTKDGNYYYEMRCSDCGEERSI